MHFCWEDGPPWQTKFHKICCILWSGKEISMKKGHFSTALLILVFFTGLSLLLYPTLSNCWNNFHQSRAIAAYADQVEKLDNDRYGALWANARRYNEALTEKADRYQMSDQERLEYESLLNVSGSGIIGYIEIPIINCSLPIYHGTDESVLQIAVGHVEGTSLPVGGPGTHSVLSGHRGLPSARLFTDLDKLTVGDRFTLRVLDAALTYEVDQILTVLPYELDALEIEPEKDYCTLVTCTPYGINSHRLLVRGRRVQEQTQSIQTAGTVGPEPLAVASLVVIPVLIILLIVLLVTTRKRK